MKTAAISTFDIEAVRLQFPILNRKVNGKPLLYFDNASTAQKPLTVINAITNFYKNENSNVHRGVHTLSQEASALFEKSRLTLQKHLNAEHAQEIIFTSGTTDSINLVAQSFGKAFILEGDEVLISAMEHHSNIVPWQLICEEKKAKLQVIPINEKGEISLEHYTNLMNERTKIVAITHVSNTLGTINPVKEMISLAHQKNIPVLLDGAQAVPHMHVDVLDLDCDFYCFSAHKVFASTGLGVLYGKEKWLNAMPPYRGGGGMIKEVSFEKTTFNELPFKFEAGTPHIEAVISIANALDYLNEIGLDAIAHYEHELLEYATRLLKEIPSVRLIGEAIHKASVISFVVEGIHPFDIGTILDKFGIAVRTGHHCTQPLMKHFNIPGTVRFSIAFYNTKEEIETFIHSLKKAIQMLQ